LFSASLFAAANRSAARENQRAPQPPQNVTHKFSAIFKYCIFKNTLMCGECNCAVCPGCGIEQPAEEKKEEKKSKKKAKKPVKA
jgi:hypothetical protein